MWFRPRFYFTRLYWAGGNLGWQILLWNMPLVQDWSVPLYHGCPQKTFEQHTPRLHAVGLTSITYTGVPKLIEACIVPYCWMCWILSLILKVPRWFKWHMSFLHCVFQFQIHLCLWHHTAPMAVRMKCNAENLFHVFLRSLANANRFCEDALEAYFGRYRTEVWGSGQKTPQFRVLGEQVKILFQSKCGNILPLLKKNYYIYSILHSLHIRDFVQ